MKKTILFLLLFITITCQAQLNLTGKSITIMGSDSTHALVNGNIYRGSDGLLRFMYNGVHHRFATTGESTTASNGLTEVGNDIRLGGALTGNTIVSGATLFDITFNQIDAFTVNPASVSFTPTNNFNVVADGSLNLSSNGIATVSSTDDVEFSSGTGLIESLTKHRFTSGGTNAGMNWGSVTSDPTSLVDGDSWYRSDLDVYRGRANGATITFGTGTIGGTIAATQVGYGSGVNTLTSEAAFNYTAASNTLQVNAGTINVLGPNNGTALLVEDDLGNNIIVAQEIAGATYLDLTGSGNATFSFAGDVTVAGTNSVSLSTSGAINISNPTDNNALTSLIGRNSSTGNLEERTVASITGAPAGSDTQVQFNNSGAFGADADFTFTGGNTVNIGSTGGNHYEISPTDLIATIVGGVQTSHYQYFGITNSGTGGFTITSDGASDNLTIQGTGGAHVTLQTQGAGDIQITPVGTGHLSIFDGANRLMGTATLSGGTVTVNNTRVTANSRIFLTIQGGTLTNVGSTYISARSAGTSFTISSTNVLDAATVAWLIIEPN